VHIADHEIAAAVDDAADDLAIGVDADALEGVTTAEMGDAGIPNP